MTPLDFTALISLAMWHAGIVTKNGVMATAGSGILLFAMAKMLGVDF